MATDPMLPDGFGRFAGLSAYEVLPESATVIPSEANETPVADITITATSELAGGVNDAEVSVIGEAFDVTLAL